MSQPEEPVSPPSPAPAAEPSEPPAQTPARGEEPPEVPARKGRLKRWLLVLVIVLALIMPVYVLGKHLILEHRADPAGKEVVVQVPKGSGTVQVGEMLEKAGVVRAAWLFALASRLDGHRGRLQAGEYALSPAMPLREILEILARGLVLQHQVLIPEGFTQAQILERLAQEGLVDLAEARALTLDPQFAASLGLDRAGLEGYLFPDTYQFARGLPARTVLTTMVKRFQQAWQPLAEQARQRGLSRRQTVTLASIIEREAKVPDERPLVSAVYHNRLKLGMKLQADPTVIYGQPDYNGSITRAQLDRDHPYNTYVRPGLPPGPICSPGVASLRAAVAPAAVDYLYFVARGDGSHAFSTNYNDQVNNVHRLRQQTQGRP